MSLQNTINDHIKQAMIAKEKDKLAALRAVKAALIVEMTKDGADSVPDDVAEKIISKLVKQRKESASIFTEQGREDLAKDEITELEYLEVYLPEQMSEDDIRSLVKKTIVDVGAQSLKDMGKVMGNAMQLIGSEADGSIVQKIVREELS